MVEQRKLTTNDPRQFSVCMGMDAFRLCIGLPTRNFTAAEVIRWLRLMGGL